MRGMIEKAIYKFADWLFQKLYDEPTYYELEQKCMKLESKVEELEEALYYKVNEKYYDEEY